MRHLKVDCYGQVLRNQELARGEGRSTKLETIGRYRFNLAFENSVSVDHVTEKFFDPLVAGCVPVYLCAPNVEDFAPGERCYVDTSGFQSPRHLAEYLLWLAKNPAEYDSYFAWKSQPLRTSFLDRIELRSGIRSAVFANGCSLSVTSRGRRL